VKLSIKIYEEGGREARQLFTFPLLFSILNIIILQIHEESAM
jgi:hypothetical protein